MDEMVGRDVARQTANVVGALFQVVVTFQAAAGINAVTDGSGPPPLIEPASYAFAIWSLIFGLSLVYAMYQALPVQRANPLLRGIGWWTAAAFACTGLWSIFVPRRELILAQISLLAIGLCLGVAFFRLIATARQRQLSPGERWCVGLVLGPFFAWMTAANPVSLYSFLAGPDGLLTDDRFAAELIGALVLLLTGTFAAVVVRAGKAAPPQAYLSYAATILWAVVGIVVNQYAASSLVTAAAVLAAVPVMAALALPARPLPPARRWWASPRTEAA